MKDGRRAHLGGLAAEDIAVRHYEALGAQILARRWRSEAGEVDLIAAFPDVVVFVEVKARRGGDAAAEAISARQWRRIGQAATIWMAENGDHRDCRFDALLVDRSGAVECVENAVSFDE